MFKQFIETIDKDLNEIKLNINTQARIIATYFMTNFSDAK